MEAEQLLGATLLGVIIGIPAYRRWQATRSRRRIEAGQCVRCGQSSAQLINLTRHEVLALVPVLLCAACATRTLRNHRWAFRAYFIFASCAFLAAAWGIGADLRAGVRYSLQAVLVIAGVVLGMLFYGWMFWRSARPPASRNPSGTL